MYLTREQAIHDIIEHDLDNIFEDHPERTLAELLQYGCKGLKDYSDKELQEQYELIFEEKLKLVA